MKVYKTGYDQTETDMQLKQMKRMKKEYKITQLGNAINRIMWNFTIDTGNGETQCGVMIPERSYNAIKELILHEVKIRFPINK